MSIVQKVVCNLCSSDAPLTGRTDDMYGWASVSVSAVIDDPRVGVDKPRKIEAHVCPDCATLFKGSRYSSVDLPGLFWSAVEERYQALRNIQRLAQRAENASGKKAK